MWTARLLYFESSSYSEWSDGGNSRLSPTSMPTMLMTAWAKELLAPACFSSAAFSFGSAVPESHSHRQTLFSSSTHDSQPVHGGAASFAPCTDSLALWPLCGRCLSMDVHSFTHVARTVLIDLDIRIKSLENLLPPNKRSQGMQSF